MSEKPTPRSSEGEVSSEEAIAALKAIQRNVDAGLMPTTGGAVSLMSKHEVDVLYDANQGSDGTFVPKLPDAYDHTARDRQEWYIAAIEQALFNGDFPFSPAHAHDMDAQLSSYFGSDVDWARIHSYALRIDPTVLPKGDSRCWARDGDPLSIVAFCGEDLRSRIPNHSATSSSATLARPSQGASRSGPTSVVGNKSGLPSGPSAHKAKRRKILIAGLGALVAVIAAVAVTLGTAKHWTKADVPEQAGSFNEEFLTGTHVVLDDLVPPCAKGQKWTSCINSHMDEFKGACADVELTPTSKTLCDGYSDMIKDMKDDYAEPGWYVTSLGDAGHLTKYAMTDVRRVSNNNNRPVETHEAVCYLGFIGECDDSIGYEEYETGVYMVVADGVDFCAGLKTSRCYKLLKAEYAGTCGNLNRAELTDASWKLCRGYAKDVELTTPTSDTKDIKGSYSSFGSLTKIPVTAVRRVSADQQRHTGTPSERGQAILRNLLNSAETVKMRAQYEEDLRRGDTREDLVAGVKRDLDQGLIAKPTACVFLGLIYNMPDDVIIKNCSTKMKELLTGNDSHWGENPPKR